MSVLSKGTTFSTGQQVTATNLNNVVDSATFLSGATDSVTTQLSGGAIIVKDGGISTAKLADGSVSTVKLADSGVTTAKVADGAVTTAKLADGSVTAVKVGDAELAAIAGLTSAADKLPYFTGSGTAALADFTAFGRSLVDDAAASNARTTLGLGTLATASTINDSNWSGTDLAVANGGTGVSTVPSNGQLLIGNGSGYTVAALTAGSNVTITNSSGGITIAATSGGGGSGTVTSVNVSGGTTGLTYSGGPVTTSGTITMAGTLAVASGGTGATDAGTARTNLGLGSLATANTISDSNWSGTDLAVTNGGTGASDAGTARTNLGIGSMATRALTISTSSPTGGSDGDVWFKY